MSSPVEDCADAIDNDGDGGVDCIDPDCYRSPDCPVPLEIEIMESKPSPGLDLHAQMLET